MWSHSSLFCLLSVQMDQLTEMQLNSTSLEQVNTVCPQCLYSIEHIREYLTSSVKQPSTVLTREKETDVFMNCIFTLNSLFT